MWAPLSVSWVEIGRIQYYNVLRFYSSDQNYIMGVLHPYVIRKLKDQVSSVS